MRILALDASTDVCAVALGAAGHWRERAEKAGQRHSEMLLPMVRALLDDASLDLRDLDGIAFGAGPGSFTGLRIACGVAQGLALGAGLPLIGIATLEAMAQASYDRHGSERVIAALDARMQEVYIAAYQHEGHGWRATIEPVVTLPREAPIPPGGSWSAAGNGFAIYPVLGERFGTAVTACDATILPTATAIGVLALSRFAAGEGVAARDAAPLYVRHHVALTRAERAAGLSL